MTSDRHAGPGRPEGEPPAASATPSPEDGTAAAGPVAAALMAAVRAVESGERSADSFFTEPARRRAPA
ncbi:hypothetical protein AB0K09_27135, partial [Streptomyces sp. NPDC049577]|uniref:hypothetical protein n=1 Tax=Streptomyces sp. NPDC049577 TaxID=3155153 RepID=UPI0034121062